MRFLVLGPLDVASNGDSTLGGPKQRAVLGMLVSRVGQPVSNDSLVDGIWGEDPPDEVQASLRSYVSNLRTGTGADIERSGAGYILNADPAAVDAFEFERLTDEATKSLSADPDGASEKLREGLALWRGKPYADLLGIEGLQSEIRRLEELRLSAVEARIDADLALGRHRVLAGELAALATEYPLREHFQSQLMVALYRDGRQSEALRAFQRTKDYLREQLGVDPSTELQGLELRILNHDPDLLTVRDTVTEHLAFLFTDIAGSTELWETRSSAMRSALARHDEILSKAIDNAGGRLFKHTGDGVLAAFASVRAATDGAVDAQRELQAADWGDLGLAVRMAVDVGEVDVRGGDYFGPPMNRGSRVMSAGHGGQILLSDPAQQALSAEPGIQLRSLGEHRLKGLGAPVRIFQLLVDGLPEDFLDLRLDGATSGPSRQFGDAIRGYEVRERLAAGRISVVYRAFQPTVGREVAVKVIRPEYANHPSFVRRFESEARTVAGLEHPHIVSLYDYWRDADGAYLVMPLMAGGSLADKNLGALPLDRVVGMIAQVGSALGYAHRQGVIHRDIKPSNILLDADGNAYLGDFGIAVRGVERDAGIQSESAIHRAPEDRAGAAVDERSDVYSLARVVAGLLTGAGAADPDLTTLDGPLRDLLESALAKDPADRPETVDSFVGRLSALNGGMTLTAEPVVSRNPYKGLSPFDVDDARDFFGRDQEIRRLVELVGHNRMVTVVGPSGSGKSSLVRAGLLPALVNGALPGSDRWVTVTTVPGSHPFDELAAALNELATESMGDMTDELAYGERGLLRISKSLMRDLEGELVIVVDQFEELYTVVTSDDVRRSFIQNLIDATADARSRVRVVLTLRADFFDHPLGDELLGPIVSESILPLAVPKPAELRDAIERPAENAGVVFENGLTDQLLGDVQEQPGSLPLMQYALASLVAQSLDGRVSIADYERVGGVSGALTSRADEVYRSLGTEEQLVGEEVFMRLVSVSDDADDVRRRVRQSELESLGLEPGHVAEVLRKFGEARLLTFDRDPLTRGPTVEVAHEALLRNWVRFRGWLDARREALILHRRFRAAEAEWEQSTRDDTYLLAGGRLSQFEAWAAGSDVVLTPDESEFLADSTAAREAAEARRRRIRRGVLTGFGVAALVAAALAVAAVIQRNQAQESAEVAEARELVLEAEKVLEADPELSAHLALTALASFRSAGEPRGPAESALRDAIAADRITLRVPGGEFVGVHPDGSLLATMDGDGVAVRDMATGAIVDRYGRDDATANGVAFSPDGNLLAVTFRTEPAVTIWNRLTGETFSFGSHPVDLPTQHPVFSPNGEFLAVGTGIKVGVEVWSVPDGQLVYETGEFGEGPDFNGDGLLSYARNPDAEEDGASVVIVDPASGRVAQTLGTDYPFLFFTAWSPDGTLIAAADQEEAIVLDVATGEEVARTDLDRVFRPEWLPAGDAFVLGGETLPRVIDAATGEVLVELTGQGGSWDYDVVPGTTLVASAGFLGSSELETVVFDTNELGGLELGGWVAPLVNIWEATYYGDGSRVVMSDNQESYLTGRDADGSEVQFTQGGPTPLTNWFPVVGGNGAFVGAPDRDGLWVVRATDTGEVTYRAPEGWTIRGVSWDGTKAVIREITPDELFDPWRGPNRLVSAHDDSTIELATPQMLWAIFSPNGELVFTTHGPDGLALFDAASGELLANTGNSEYDGAALAFTADGTTLAIGSFVGDLYLFDVSKLLATGSFDEAEVLRITAHDSQVRSLAFSPDASMAATSARNDRLKLWDLDTGQQLGEFGGELEGRFSNIGAFHPTLPHLMVTTPLSEVRIHTLDVDELIAIARAGLSREMTEEECQRYFREPCPAP